MKPRAREAYRRSRYSGERVPNWIPMAGGVLLSALSMRLGYKLKQLRDAKQSEDSSKLSKGSQSVEEVEQQCRGQMLREPEMALVTVPTPESNKDSGAGWPSSPNHVGLHHKPFHHSNGSDSPSESGSDILSKREVIQKLRHQLKRRDDMILDMQDRIAELQNSLNSQLAHNSHLQALLDAANRDLFDSEREAQLLRKGIADHCAGHVNSDEDIGAVPNGHNGYRQAEASFESLENGSGDAEKMEMLKGEINELKELIDGKDYLLRSYKEQRIELSMKIKELHERLDSQLPNIL
ncbi:uncharacterized protein LOC127263215 isoform X2 [Andrographis paniculata]|uniref:uncharacterized protein LOC127263215 isoform X2 n=1 Tax=Andrographis paniculata TaxID=175694 RepID=UPI0021E76DF0|nr:uncharacterized protein LOC127263215 isoform X2 [Andrographis paniculata]